MKIKSTLIQKYLLCLLCGAVIFISNVSGAANPPEVAVYFGNKPPLGSGTVSALLIKLYEVTVGVQGDRWSWNRPFVLQLKYDKNFASNDIVSASVDEINKLHRLDDSTEQRYKKIFAGIFPSVKVGDTIAAVYLPNQDLLFFHNSQAIGSIKNPQLARQFLDIWLSERSRDPDLRNAILHID